MDELYALQHRVITLEFVTYKITDYWNSQTKVIQLELLSYTSYVAMPAVCCGESLKVMIPFQLSTSATYPFMS